MSGRKIESANERWLLARMAAPRAGMLLRPTTQGRKIALMTGPITTYFMNQ